MELKILQLFKNHLYLKPLTPRKPLPCDEMAPSLAGSWSIWYRLESKKWFPLAALQKLVSVSIWLAYTMFTFDQRLSPTSVLEKGVLQNFTKLARKYLCQNLFFNEIAGVDPSQVHILSVQENQSQLTTIYQFLVQAPPFIIVRFKAFHFNKLFAVVDVEHQYGIVLQILYLPTLLARKWKQLMF